MSHRLGPGPVPEVSKGALTHSMLLARSLEGPLARPWLRLSLINDYFDIRPDDQFLTNSTFRRPTTLCCQLTVMSMTFIQRVIHM